MVETTAKASGEKPHVLFCGGFHSSMQGTKAAFLCKLCIRYGWGFTRFDYLGHGASDAAIEHCSLHDWLNDTLAVLDGLDENVIMVGSSMGAWLAVLACLQRTEKIGALLTIAAAPDFTETLLWAALSLEQKNAINNDRCVVMPSAYEGEDWRLRRCLFDSGRDLALLNTTEPLQLTMPVRMLHGTHDTDVPWSLSQQLLERFAHSQDAALILLRGADHRLSDEFSLGEIEATLNQLVNKQPLNK